MGVRRRFVPRPAKPWVWWRGVEALCHIEVGGVRTGSDFRGRPATARDDCSGHHLEEHHNVRPYFLEREIVPQAAEQSPAASTCQESRVSKLCS